MVKMERNIAVEIKNLNFAYPDGTRALKNINMQIETGDSVGLIGPNGAGKTTLLLHLNGILRGDGEVKIFNTLVNKKSLKEVRKKVGLVFQDPDDQLFMPTVFDDVSFGPINLGFEKEKVMEKVKEALKMVEMENFIDKSPHHLSFGEKKKISLATVFSMDPEILALDEPSSNLDPRGKREIVKILEEIKETKIIATHDLGIINLLCQRVILMCQGEIITEGDTEIILKNKELLEKYYL